VSNDIGSAKPGEPVAATSALDDAVDAKDDDANLFEEEKELDLIDPNAETADGHEHKISERTTGDEVSLAALSPAAPKESSSKLASGKVKQASKKKRDHKPPARDPDKPIIMMLDSLGQTRTVATRALRQWLEAEGRDKRGMDVEIDNRGLYPKGSQIPTQNNYSDCGLYVLGYLRKFFMNPNEFTKKLLRYEMSAESDWPDMDPSKMREEIRDLIFELNDARDGARKEAHKAKKHCSSKNTSASPTKAGSKEVSHGVKQTETTETQSGAAAAAVIEATSTSAATTGKTVTPPADAPRLGSPFRPSAATEAAQKDNTARASLTAQGLPSASMETLVQQRQSSAKRAKSPEVRIAVTSPHESSIYKPFDSAGDRSTQPTRRSADLTSSLQNHDLRSTGEGKLRMPSAKSGKVISPSNPMRQRPMPSSPSQARTRSGSHDDPIPVDDSQDLDVPARNHSQSAREPPPEVVELDRSQESVRGPFRRVYREAQSSPIRHREVRQQFVNRDDSIREVDGREWEEQNDPEIMRATEESLENERERLTRRAHQHPQLRDYPMEDILDAQVAYSQFSHTVHEIPDTQDPQPMEVDSGDEVIPESPEQRTSSPMLMD
jgi:sentrin-specific protease 7